MMTEQPEAAGLDEATDVGGPMIGWIAPGQPLPVELITPWVKESEDALEIRIDLPGFRAESVAVSVEGAELHLHALRPADEQVLERSFVLSAAVDVDHLRARIDGDSLVVVAPKRPRARLAVPVDLHGAN